MKIFYKYLKLLVILVQRFVCGLLCWVDYFKRYNNVLCYLSKAGSQGDVDKVVNGGGFNIID